MSYRNYLNTRAKKVIVKPSVVSAPIAGREADMTTSSGGAGYAFVSKDVERFKRWLVFGSAGSTMYANSHDITLQNLEVVNNMLAQNYKQAIDIVQDFSVRNVVKGQKTLLTVLSMALSYDDRTVRIYGPIGYSADIHAYADNDSAVVQFSDTVHRIGFNADATVLYAMIYDKTTNGKYRFEAYDLKAITLTSLKEKPENVKWYEHAYRPDKEMLATNYSLAARSYAADATRAMHRQSSILFEDVANIDTQRGWGSITHRVITDFYLNMDNSQLAQQLIKYGVRQGWSHRDLLRKVKPNPGNDEVRSKLYAWAADKFDAYENVTPNNAVDGRGYIADPLTKLWAADALKHAQTAKEVAKIVSDYQMPREAVERANTKWLKEAIVWEALLPSMPGVALVRNLRNMAELGLIAPMSDTENYVISKLTDSKFMSRVHPIQVMQAAVTYDPSVFAGTNTRNANRSRKADITKSYNVSQAIVNALNTGLHHSYQSVEPTNKRIMIAIDISGSMYFHQLDNFYPFFPGEAAGMMALIFAHKESRYYPMAFASELHQISLGNTSSISDMIKELTRYSFGATDIGLPIQYALKNKMQIDAFISITDNEVNTGYHPSTLIQQYRQKMGIPAQFITIAMQANNITVADPNDPLMLDVAGCSADTHDIVSSYIRGDF